MFEDYGDEEEEEEEDVEDDGGGQEDSDVEEEVGGDDATTSISGVLNTLSQNVRELSLGTCGEVPKVVGPLSALEFLREYVMPGRPCIITDAISHWPALQLWSSNEYLCSKLQHQHISLHCTPDGRADALVPISPLVDDGAGSSVVFVSALVEQVEFPQALERIVGGSRCCGCLQEDDEVAYAQQQNGCFKSEYSSLASDADAHIPWATEALGCMPEAVNLWIGNQRSVTSFHKDHYENLYAVVTGEKHFTLLPPTDLHRMYIRSYPSAHYVRGRSSELVIEEDRPTAMVPWVSVDPFPLPSDRKEAESKYPLYFDGPKPFSCTVRAGELLYLPSMWFHHVRQTPDPKGPTIALNYWYDMQFDIKYAYFNLLESLAAIV